MTNDLERQSAEIAASAAAKAVREFFEAQISAMRGELSRVHRDLGMALDRADKAEKNAARVALSERRLLDEFGLLHNAARKYLDHFSPAGAKDVSARKVLADALRDRLDATQQFLEEDVPF